MALDQWSQFLKDNRLESGAHSKSVLFASGLVLSIQASSTHYCSPKEDDPEIGWDSFEVYAYASVALSDQRILGKEHPTCVDFNDPIGWVTIAKLDELALNHGGIVGPAPNVWEEDN